MFTTLDWSIIIGYLIFAFGIGIIMTKKASTGLSSYFVADRSLPWWWLGTSMVATTFAADTPLAITGIVAKDGIAGNWFWWSWIFTYITMTVFMAKKWRSSNVLTDVELTELRYDGDSAKILRGFKAFFLSIVINCIIMGWVFRAMSKITDPFISWKSTLGAESFNTLSTLWPSFLIFDNLNNTLTVLVIFLIVIGYSSMGGIRGVIVTDLFQFVLAMGAAVIFAVYALDFVGGSSGLIESIHNIYPDNADSILSFWPSFDNAVLPFQVFLIFIGIQWWTLYFSDGSGYYAQRMNTAKTPKDAEKGALWFTIANFGLRTWPWIIIGLVSIVVFPLENPTQYHEVGMQVGADREMGYPVLMKLILPSGLLGLTFVSLMAAFMSTVDTHLNWGASYLINDIYRRFIKPSATQKELVWASRICVIFIAVLSIMVATQINSIEGAWKFIVSLAAGLGITHLMRWFWWRVNAWTEISGMLTAFTLSIVLHLNLDNIRDEYIIFIIAIVSLVVSITVTLLTKPVSDEHLRKFVEQVKPVGFWKSYGSYNPIFLLKERILIWILGVTTTFTSMFGIGYLVLGSWVNGILNLSVFAVSLYFMLKKMNKED
ncbi:MAG: Na+:solute symporter [Bacteroidia bacterium]|nr:Na+:solute symporter [Bacteroidia bacterium]